MNDDLHRILIKGGVTSPGELKDSISMLEAAGLCEVHFGSRQDLLFPLNRKDETPLERISKYNTDIVSERTYQNIVSSYVSADIFEMTHWLKGSTYLYILEEFDYLPKLKINITDPKQRLVPLYSGNLNFIASEQEDYWYLYLNIPSWTSSEFYPVLIYSYDIVAISRAIEHYYPQAKDVPSLFEILNEVLDTNNKNVQKKLETPYLTFPYYEGVNRMGLDQYWLGLYWRNNRYDLQFLKDFCGFCLDNSIGKICITPWKSFIVKGIKQKYRSELERFIGQRGINIRHSQLEMNWHLPVDDLEAFELKKFLVRNFDENDISTYGLTFGISSDAGKRSHFASIIIEKNQSTSVIKDFKVRPTYNVLHFKAFDPNTQVYVSHAQDVDQMELPSLLMELSKKYFKELGKTSLKKVEIFENENIEIEVHQCESCMTIYDSSQGDEKNKVAVGVAFENLPEEYRCPVCDAPPSNFNKVLLQI